MNQETPDLKEVLAAILIQEETLQFERFTFDDAWQLGLILRENVLAHGGNAAVDITVNGVELFHCAACSPTPNNGRWISRKMNTVLETWKSSLRLGLEMSLSGRTLEEFGLGIGDYSLSGGSFPIRVKGQGVIGAVTVSGLPDTHDHQMAVDALSAYLDVNVPGILK